MCEIGAKIVKAGLFFAISPSMKISVVVSGIVALSPSCFAALRHGSSGSSPSLFFLRRPPPFSAPTLPSSPSTITSRPSARNGIAVACSSSSSGVIVRPSSTVVLLSSMSSDCFRPSRIARAAARHLVVIFAMKEVDHGTIVGQERR